jgi:hypothetical protein
VDPPPDLVIEIDVTSTTALQAYAALQVPELWRYHNRALQIFILRDGTYVISPRSPIFPHIPVVEGVTQFVEMSRTAGTAPALRAFRQWVQEHIQP